MNLEEDLEKALSSATTTISLSHDELDGEHFQQSNWTDAFSAMKRCVFSLETQLIHALVGLQQFQNESQRLFAVAQGFHQNLMQSHIEQTRLHRQINELHEDHHMVSGQLTTYWKLLQQQMKMGDARTMYEAAGLEALYECAEDNGMLIGRFFLLVACRYFEFFFTNTSLVVTASTAATFFCIK